MMDTRSYLGLLLDPLRLAILGRAAEGPVDVDELATRLAEPPRRIRNGLSRLVGAGLLTDDLELNRVALRELAASLPQDEPASDEVAGQGMWTPEEKRVLGRFFSGSRLTQIPTSRSKRLTVLDRLAQEFEPGLRYSEPEVNFTLQLWYADYAALRRYLVDEGFMTRADGVYWRTGGRYPASSDDPPEPETA